MRTNKFEQLVEYIINEDEAKAKALFHQIVVEKSRDIYESLEEESRFPVQRGRGAESLSNEIEDHSDSIDGDEHGMHEDEEFGNDEFGDDEAGDEFSDDDAALGGDEEFGGDEAGLDGEGEIEDRVMDLEDAIDELKAEFDQLMAGEEHEEEEFPGIHGDEEGSDVDSADGEEGKEGDEEFGDDDEEEKEVEESASVYEAKEDAKAKKEKEAKAKKEKEAKAKKEKDVKESRKSPADLMREYVEKVSTVKPAEGDFVGTGAESGGKPTVNKKSTQISGKNDMGGSSANIARGGSEAAPDGTSPKKASNPYTKGETKMGRDSYANTAGGRGDKLSKVSKPSSKEGSPAGAKNTDPSKTNDKSTGQPTNGKPGFKG